MSTNILKYRQGIFFYDAEKMKSAEDSKIRIGLSPLMTLKPDIELFGFQLTISIADDENELMRYGFVLSMMIPGWIPLTSSDMTIAGQEENIPSKIRELLFSRASNQIKEICETAIGFANGAVTCKMADEDTIDAILTGVDLNRFVSSLKFRVV